jgi:hypothetical protein
MAGEGRPAGSSLKSSAVVKTSTFAKATADMLADRVVSGL